MYLLETKRLRFRQMIDSDAAFLLTLLNDPAYIAGVRDNGLRTIGDAHAYIRDKVLPGYTSPGFGPHPLELKDGGGVIGFCGLFRRKEFEAPDIGYALLPEARGRGFAMEAAQAMLEFARDRLGLRTLNGLTEPSNHASIRILRGIGMQYVRTFKLEGYPGQTAMYSVTFPARESV